MSDKLFAWSVVADKTDVSIPFRLLSTAGAAVTGKLATNLTLSYWRQGGTRTAITASDLAAVNSAHSDGGVKEVDSTNFPGLYRLDLPDAAVASGADWVCVGVVCSGAVDYETWLPIQSSGTVEIYSRIGAPAGASVSADVASVASTLSTVSTNVSTALNRIGAFTGSGLNTILGFLKAMASKAAALTPSDMGGTYDNTTDALEAIKDAGTSATISDGDMTTIAGRVWNNTYAATRTLTQSAASVAAALSGSDISIRRGDTVTIALTGLGNVSTRTALYFTVKSNLQGADSDAIIQVSEAGGLLVLNGASAATASNASLTVTDATSGNVSIVLKAALTTTLTVMSGLSYDIQMVTASGVTTLTEGDAAIVADVTRAVS